MRDTISRISWLLDHVRSRLLAWAVRVRAGLDPHQAAWKTQIRSLQEREKRQALWRETRPVLMFAVAYIAAWSYLFIAAFLGAKPPPTPLFVPGAVLFSAILLSPSRHWWRYLVAAFVIQVPVLAYLHVPLLWNLLGYIPDAIEPIVAAGLLLLLISHLPPRFASLREVSVYTVCVAVAVLIAATIGAAVNAALGGEPYVRSWITWYLGDILAYLIVAPTLLLWIAAGRSGLRPGTRWRFAEAISLYGGLLVLGVFVFEARALNPELADALIYLPVPLLLWAAVRFGPGGIASALSLLVVVSIPAVADALGPFASTSVPAAAVFDNILTLQLFLLVIGVPLLFLAALMQERGTAESALRTSEARYQAVVETQTEFITRYQSDMTLTFVNDATCRFGGKSREELLGTSMLADMPEHAATRVRAMVEGLLAQPDPGIVTIEHEVWGPDGSLHWQQWVNRTILDASGHVVELQGIGRDITDRKLAEEQVHASEARYRMVVRTLPQTAVLLFDVNLRHTFADGPGLQLVGLTPEGLEGRTVWEALPEPLAAALAPHYEAALSGQAVAQDIEHAQHTFHVQVVPLPAAERDPAASGITASPVPTGMLVLQDVTEQRRARDELERERILTTMLGALSMEFRTLADHSPDFIGRLDPSGHLLYINQAAEELLGLTAEQWVGKSFAELRVGRDVYEPWVQALREVMETRAPRIFDAEAQASDGSVRSLHTRLIPELAADGTLQSVLGIATDVSALKQAEARLTQQAGELATIFESQADGVGVYDLAGRFVRANTALRDLLGLDADASYTALPFEQRTQRLRLYDEQGETLPLEQWPQWRVLRGEILAGASAMETGVRTLDGRDRWLSITGAPLRAADGSGHATGVVLIARDVTARRALERQTTEQASELTAIFEAQADVVVVYDQHGRFVRGNRAWEDFFHQHADLRRLSAQPVFVAMPVADQVAWVNQQVQDEHGQIIPVEARPTARALRGETVTGSAAVDEWVQLVDGREVLVSVSAAPMRDNAGHITGVVVVGHDVTARRQLERQVREQAAQLEATFEAMTDGVAVLDAHGHISRINLAGQALFGLTMVADHALEESGPTAAERAKEVDLRDLTGQPVSSTLVPSARLLRGELLTGANALTLRLGPRDERERSLSFTGGPLRDAVSGKIVGAVEVVRDVTELQRVQAALAEQERLFRTLVENSPDIIARFDRQLRYLYISPAIRQVSPLKLAEADYVGKTNAELGWPEDAYGPAQRAIEQVFQTGRPQTLEESNAEFADSETARSFRAQFLPERAADGRVESVLTVTTDITALKRTEQALLAANASLETARQEEARRKRIAESLRGVLALLNSKRPPREVFQYIVHQAEELLGSAAAVIYGPAHLTDSVASETQVETLRIQAAEGLRIVGRRPRLRQRLPFAEPAVGQVLASAQPVALVDARGHLPVGREAGESDAADGDATIARLHGALPAPYRALLVVPILVHAGLYGCLLLFYPQPHRFEAEEVALAQTYADQVAQAITNARLQVHLEQEAAAVERNRIAQELHDTVKQELFSTSLIAQSLPTVWQTQRAAAEAMLRQLHAMSQSAYAGLQALLLELRPAALEQLPLAETLRQLGTAMSNRAGMPIVVDLEGAATPEPPMPAAVKLAFYRVAQESLMNAAKYAHAQTLRMRLRMKGTSRVELEVADDGRGFDPESIPGGHFGLTIMRERAQSVGASLQVQSHAEQGTAVIMSWRGGRDVFVPEQLKQSEREAIVGGGPS